MDYFLNIYFLVEDSTKVTSTAYRVNVILNAMQLYKLTYFSLITCSIVQRSKVRVFVNYFGPLNFNGSYFKG